MERKRSGESERQRVPQPLIKKRIASGRGAMEQPNVTHDGDARLTPQFWVAVVVTGIATGLFAMFLMWLLHLLEHVAFRYDTGSFQSAAILKLSITSPSSSAPSPKKPTDTCGSRLTLMP